MDRRSKAKIKQFVGDLIVIGKDEIQKYLDYAKEKYGSEFHLLLTGQLPPPKGDGLVRFKQMLA